ncbi:MAG: alpha/beta hydrolase, partial [Acidobacteria bacterium]|nr:alpha/beta hydrolase [Acidobacteriota bacterium]
MPEVAQDRPATASSGLAQQLHAFRQSHAYTRRTAGGTEWEYIACGRGHDALLLLPGGLSTGESLYRHIVELESEFRILAPSYPAVGAMRELSDGLAAIFDAEGVSAAHVVGASYGGLVAQAFAFHHPRRTRSLVLSHTAGPDPRRGSILRIVLKVFGILPASWMQAAFHAKIRSLLRHPQLEHAERQFLEEYLAESLALLSPQALDMAYARVVDFCLHYPAQQPVWNGATLILESDDDPAVRPRERARLRAAYPHAQVHIFHAT